MSDHHLHLHAHNEPGTVHPPAEYRVGLIDEYVESAAEAGVTELGFTEHLYRCVEAEDALGRFWDVPGHPELSAHSEAFVSSDRTLSLEAYVQVVLEAKHRGLPVQLGLEIDFFPESIDAVLELIEPYPWDFLIGSVHWIGPWAIDSSEVAWEFDRRGVDQAWYDYFQLVEALAASGTVDVLAHVDVCKKYGYRPEREPIDMYAAVVEAAARTGTAVEVSSQGLRNPAGEIYPSPTFLRMFHDAGVPITLASDGHTPEHAGWGHAEVVSSARAAGYVSRLSFDRRRRAPAPL
ncbi:MAG TPA: histidinol-phosphatase HisJ family protein [Acidimicrobiia bacterium]